ncbi:MAG: 2-oxoacid:acceptor oxidoreductase family protein [Eubacteriales bacterium]
MAQFPASANRRENEHHGKQYRKEHFICGVGGQGTILMSKTLTYGLVAAGYDVKMSEVHGMAQRGGSVSTQVRYGEKVYSPIIGRGEADVLVAFEKLEAARYSELLAGRHRADQRLRGVPRCRFPAAPRNIQLTSTMR